MKTVTFDTPRKFWFQRTEAALNWVALGLLLAAWNACDNSAPTQASGEQDQAAPRRPEALAAYTYVSVRAYKGHETVNEL